MLEVFVLTGILVALWALRSPRETTTRLVLAGAFLGVGASTKLWGFAPLAVIAAWLLILANVLARNIERGCPTASTRALPRRSVHDRMSGASPASGSSACRGLAACAKSG